MSVTLIDVNTIRCVWHISVEILIKYFVETDEQESDFSIWTDSRTHRKEANVRYPQLFCEHA